MQPKPMQQLELPTPDAASAQHSARVQAYIRDAIVAGGGSISFAEFMQHALYAPGLGYYSAGATKLGPNGDFVTAPEISPLFGRVLARQAATVLAALGGGDLLEFGAGSGALAVSVLKKLDELNSLPAHYFVLEVSADFRERQEAHVKTEAPEYLDLISWINDFPADFSGVVVANEVADAIPVERFQIQGGHVLQARVVNDDSNFAIDLAPAPKLLTDAVRAIETMVGRGFVDGYESEVSHGVVDWVSKLANSIKSGLLFLIDYGVTRSEYYAADRNNGWLRCHFRHRAHNDPLLNPGIQDITCWVDFSTVAMAAEHAGMSVAGYVTQANFLLNGGLQDELVNFETLTVAEQIELSGRIKMLTLPAEMGENFKCLGLARGDIEIPPGLKAFDQTHRL